MCKAHSKVTHIKQQKYFHHTQLYSPFEKAAQLYAKKMKVNT